MDERKVQDHLEKAGIEYNAGRYNEAIEQWQRVLEEDPDNQKAREGIRMAQLLVVNWEASGAAQEGAELQVETGDMDPDLREKIEFGIKRVRDLLSAGRYHDAMEGCALLSELAPGMESVRKLVEEATHAFEAQPVIAEHLGKARKLLGQGKTEEAAEEARNVLSIDSANAEAQEILRSITPGAPAEPGPRRPSAFDVDVSERPAPPAHFAETEGAGGPAGAFDAGDTGPQPAVLQDRAAASSRPSPPAVEPPDGAVEFDQVRPREGAAPDTESVSRIRTLLEEGRKLFAEGKYQEAIDRWSHVYILDETNAAASELIDQARARQAEIARQEDGAYQRAVDLFEAGKIGEAKTAFQEILAVQPDHAEARSYVEQIEAKEAAPSGAEELAAIPLSSGPPAASGEAGAEPDAELRAAVSAPPHSIERVRPPAPPPEEAPAPVAEEPVKKRRRAPPPPSGPRKGTLVAAAAAVIVVGGAVAAWWFVLGGAGSGGESDPIESAAVTAPRTRSDLPGAPEAGDGTGAEDPPGRSGASGESRMEVVPGSAPPPEPPRPKTPSPAETRQRINELMREGRSLLESKRYAEAKARFDEVLFIDPAYFDADDLRLRASELAAEEERFNTDLRLAKAAFDEGDWAGALYKFYRLRERRRDMAVLKLHIKNANFNWGIDAMEAFTIDEAIQHFKDALEMAPEDVLLQRSLEVAERYKRRRRDAAFDAYLSRLEPRALDQQ